MSRTGSGLRVLVLMGGRSEEHPISLRSAAAVVPALKSCNCRLTTVGISRSGRWLLSDFEDVLARAPGELLELQETGGEAVSLGWDGQTCWIASVEGSVRETVDVVFPVLHGPGGEDGSLQGLLETAGVAFVGAGSSASALAMDKLAMKYVCAGAGIPHAGFLDAGGFSASELARQVAEGFGFPCFVKPARLGSSVGISRVEAPRQLGEALELARRHDARVLVEQALDAREIEVAMLDGEPPEVSPPGEIVAEGGFYDFEAKYVRSDAELLAPASIEPEVYRRLEQAARQVWRLVGCRGLARADFFVGTRGEVYFNELNTLPGFTAISMFPRLWALRGFSPRQLYGRILESALEADRSGL